MLDTGRIERLIAVMISAVCDASKRSLVVLCTVSGQAPCPSALRQNKELDEVSTAILGDEVAENKLVSGSLIPFWLK